jgi:hypothetical protein
VKIHVAAGQAVRKKGREDETQFTTEIAGKTDFVKVYSQLRI